jgi:hypothetical protein
LCSATLDKERLKFEVETMNKEARLLVYGNVSQLSSQPSSPRRSNWHNMTLNLEQFQVRDRGLLEVGLTLTFCVEMEQSASDCT